MPYIELKTNKHLEDNIKQEINKLLDENISIFKGKSKEWLMVNILDNLKSDLDSLRIYYYETDIDSINNHGGYKISLYYNYGEDFHFIREDFDGKW